MTPTYLKQKYYSIHLVKWYEDIADYSNWLERELISALNENADIDTNCTHHFEYLSFGEDSYIECERCKTRLN